MKMQPISYEEYKEEIKRIYRDFRREMYYYPLVIRFLEEYITDEIKVIPVYDNKGYSDDDPGLHDRTKYADSHSLQDIIIVPKQYEYEKTTNPLISIEVKKPDIKFKNGEIVKYDLLKIEKDNLNQLNAEFKHCNYIIFTDCIAWYFLKKGNEIGEPVCLVNNEKWTLNWNDLKNQINLFLFEAQPIDSDFKEREETRMRKELEVTLMVKVRACFDDTESDEHTVRYLLEQDLEDAGWDCDVDILE